MRSDRWAMKPPIGGSARTCRYCTPALADPLELPDVHKGDALVRGFRCHQLRKRVKHPFVQTWRWSASKMRPGRAASRAPAPQEQVGMRPGSPLDTPKSGSALVCASGGSLGLFIFFVKLAGSFRGKF